MNSNEMPDQLEANKAKEYAAIIAALNEGIESFYRGEGLPARQAMADLGEKYGLNVPDSLEEARKFPLHSAVKRCDYEAVQACLRINLPVNALDRLGNTPLHWAVFGGYKDIAVLLLEAGAEPLALADDGETPLSRAIDFFGEEEISQLLRHAIAKKGK